MLDIENLHVAYGPVEVLHGISMRVEPGSIVGVLGANGSGKTTLFKAIAGLVRVTQGKVRLSSHDLTNVSTQSIVKQGVTLVPQGRMLFPEMTVYENLEMGAYLLRDRTEFSRRLERVQQMFPILKERSEQMVALMSGGEQQMLAIGRALMGQPDLILLDEPFSSLDVDLRERLATEMREILQTNEVTALLVTHDQLEAFAIADFVGIMTEGKILQWDTPYDLYHRPINRYVADFIGRGVFVKGSISNNHQVEIELGKLPLESHHHEPLGTVVDVLLRADDIQHDDHSTLLAEVVRKTFRGADFLYTLKLASGIEIFAFVPSHHDHAIGEKIGIHLVADHVVTFTNEALPVH
jgi:iron(III) transport system ATP-binding protein